MSAHPTFRTNILAILDDASLTRYSSAQIDADLVRVLDASNRHRPLISTYNYDAGGNQTIEPPAEFDAIKITKVELWDDDIDDTRDLPYYAWKQDEAWFIQTTGEILAAGEVITITYNQPNTIYADSNISPADIHGLTWLIGF